MDDWKDKLGAAFGIDPNADTEPQPETTPERTDALTAQGRQPLHVVFERKGRAGKQVTLVVDWKADDEAVAEVAARLKRALGVGGSARGGEILIQGDHRERVKQLLAQMGFNVK